MAGSTRPTINITVSFPFSGYDGAITLRLAHCR
jgi:hypothetical protein